MNIKNRALWAEGSKILGATPQTSNKPPFSHTYFLAFLVWFSPQERGLGGRFLRLWALRLTKVGELGHRAHHLQPVGVAHQLRLHHFKQPWKPL